MAILSKIYAHIPSLIPRPPSFVLRQVGTRWVGGGGGLNRGNNVLALLFEHSTVVLDTRH